MPPGGEAVAEEFYEGILGVPRVDKPAPLAVRGGCWFEHGDLKIHLGVEEDFRPAKKAHPALLVDDLDGLRERCGAAGISVVDDQTLSGYDRIYLDDPFGNRIEAMEQLGDAQGRLSRTP